MPIQTFLDDKEFSQPEMFENKNVTLEKVDREKMTVGDLILRCPSNTLCEDLNEPCIKCELSNKCRYGALVNTTCRVAAQVNCRGPTQFERTFICRYCYQTDHWEHSCNLLANCNSVAAPRALYITNCTVKDDILCLGNRRFLKKIQCNWTGGYRWAVSLALSISLGGFGADRFYLGYWQEGIGKLFSFGGLGVWTIIDVILISLHYLGPADGSLYI
nr:TM2 domain-containing protein almondex [Leptinotarsa decemlineata]